MWSLLQLHGETEAVCRALLAEYDVPESRLREDLAQLIEALASRGLVKILPGSPGADDGRISG